MSVYLYEQVTVSGLKSPSAEGPLACEQQLSLTFTVVPPFTVLERAAANRGAAIGTVFRFVFSHPLLDVSHDQVLLSHLSFCVCVCVRVRVVLCRCNQGRAAGCRVGVGTVDRAGAAQEHRC